MLKKEEIISLLWLALVIIADFSCMWAMVKSKREHIRTKKLFIGIITVLSALMAGVLVSKLNSNTTAMMIFIITLAFMPTLSSILFIILEQKKWLPKKADLSFKLMLAGIGFALSNAVLLSVITEIIIALFF